MHYSTLYHCITMCGKILVAAKELGQQPINFYIDFQCDEFSISSPLSHVVQSLTIIDYTFAYVI